MITLNFIELPIFFLNYLLELFVKLNLNIKYNFQGASTLFLRKILWFINNAYASIILYDCTIFLLKIYSKECMYFQLFI